DMDQGVTHIVRGIDLIDSTARQALLYQAAGGALPSDAHIPVAMEGNGEKLSNQNLARAPSTADIAGTTFTAFAALRHQPPAELRGSHAELLHWAVQHWQPQALHGMQALTAPVGFQR